MRALIYSTLIVLCLYQTAFAQTETFDVSTFMPAKIWQRTASRVNAGDRMANAIDRKMVALMDEDSSGGIAYAIPDGWSGQTFPDSIIYVSPMFNNGEKCMLAVFQMRPTSGNLQDDAINVFREVFKADPFQNSSYPYPSPTLGRGISAQGWEYVTIRKSIRGQVGDYGSLLGVTVFVAKHGNEMAAVAATSKDPLVSMCFGEMVRDEWPRFFHSLQFKNWRPTGREQAVKQRLAGKWTMATGNVAGQYTFTSSGRYTSAGAYRQPSHTLFGDGAYSIRGNVITFTADNNKSNPPASWYRLEQESKDLGRTWSDKLCLLQEEVGGEVCYRRTE